MKLSIDRITVVNQQGTSTYHIGMMLDSRVITEIKDESLEYQECIEFIYTGYDNEGDKIFQLVNCSVDVRYSKGE